MKKLLFVSLLIGFAGCSNPQKEAQEFIDAYNRGYVVLSTASSEASWKTNTEYR